MCLKCFEEQNQLLLLVLFFLFLLSPPLPDLQGRGVTPLLLKGDL